MPENSSTISRLLSRQSSGSSSRANATHRRPWEPNQSAKPHEGRFPQLNRSRPTNANRTTQFRRMRSWGSRWEKFWTSLGNWNISTMKACSRSRRKSRKSGPLGQRRALSRLNKPASATSTTKTLLTWMSSRRRLTRRSHCLCRRIKSVTRVQWRPGNNKEMLRLLACVRIAWSRLRVSRRWQAPLPLHQVRRSEPWHQGSHR